MEKSGRTLFSYVMALVAGFALTGCMLETHIFEARIDGSSSLPTFPVQLSSAATSPRGGTVFSVTVDFGSEVVTGLDASDFVVTNGAAGNLVDVGAGSSFTFDITPSGVGTYTLNIQLPSGVAKNAANLDNGASNSLAFTINQSGPSINITGPVIASGSVSTSFVYTVTYTNATTVNLTNGHITVGGTDFATCNAAVTNGTTTTATVTITNCAGDGPVNFSINANSAVDSFGNQAAASGTSSNAQVRNSFIITVDTTLGDGSTTVQFPARGWSGVSFVADWGDGSSDPFTNPGNGPITHSYSAPGVYHVKFKGTMPYFQYYGGNDREKIIDVKQWGTNVWGDMELMFAGCTNLQISAPDAPVLTSVLSMRGLFQSATSFNSPIGHWQTGNVRDMSNLFMDAAAFNQPIGTWDTSSVTTMADMFSAAVEFNQDIHLWNTASVTDMSLMFMNAYKFNQPLPHNGPAWNTSSVTTMYKMFQNADAFNQDISSWVFGSGLRYMDDMFLNADTFNQDISSWVLPPGVTHTLFDSGTDPAWDSSKKPTFPP